MIVFSPNRFIRMHDPNNGGGNMHNSHTAWQTWNYTCTASGYTKRAFKTGSRCQNAKIAFAKLWCLQAAKIWKKSHVTLHTPHFTLLTSHCFLHTPNLTLHTSHCALRTPNLNFTLHTSHFPLLPSHCTIHTAIFTPHTSHCSKPTCNQKNTSAKMEKIC